MYFKCILSIFFIVIIGKSYSQKTGYKEITVGKNINDSSLNKYRFGVPKGEDNTFVLVATNDMLFCRIPINQIIVITDANKKIINIVLLTKEILFRDYSDFISSFVKLGTCIIDVVGHSVGSNLEDLNKKNNEIIAAWIFKEENTMMSETASNMSAMAKDELRSFSITWEPYKSTSLW